ncbi:MAG TPA: ThiF family adenylyltransferase [Terriglobales bacterium]|nr:ThiF family adenylyltransferase [Terriglobales bacterium]
MRLRNEGYDLEIRSDHLLVKDVPYVAAGRVVKRGILVMPLKLAGDVTVKPDNHVAHFIGEFPCRADGRLIDTIGNVSNGRTKLGEGVEIDQTFSAKPMPSGAYDNYYDKVTQYVTILSGYAQKIEPGVNAKTFRPVAAAGDEETVFKYIDTASTRAEIGAVAAKLAAVQKIAIVGLGGTGAYVLDLVAKTPVREIHLFDGDEFLQHNAFRTPGAPSLEELVAIPKKAAYLKGIYDKMRNGIVAHVDFISADNVDALREMSFVFLCMEGTAKKFIVEKLEEFGLPFIDVGMGVYLSEGSLGGILRVTTSTPEQRDHLRKRVSFASDADRNEYGTNIQIADLNALNAALAVIKWKKLAGFYQDLDFEHHCTYTIGGNMLCNEDVPAAGPGQASGSQS